MFSSSYYYYPNYNNIIITTTTAITTATSRLLGNQIQRSRPTIIKSEDRSRDFSLQTGGQGQRLLQKNRQI